MNEHPLDQAERGIPPLEPALQPLRRYFCDIAVVRQLLPALSIPADTDLYTAFPCVLPGHEPHPAFLVRPRQQTDQLGISPIVYRCNELADSLARDRRAAQLGTVRAWQSYGDTQPIGKIELPVWSLRLLVESGILPPDDVPMPPLLDDADDLMRALAHGFRFLLMCKWSGSLYLPDAAPFTPAFARAWCALPRQDERKIPDAMKRLEQTGVIQRVGSLPAPYGRKYSLYLPGL
jgi:hypothetical protein